MVLYTIISIPRILQDLSNHDLEYYMYKNIANIIMSMILLFYCVQNAVQKIIITDH